MVLALAIIESSMAWFRALTMVQIVPLMLLENLALMLSTIVVGNWASRRWAHRRVAVEVVDPRPAEVRLGYISVLMNTIVTVGGWALWKSGSITVTSDVSIRVLFEVLVLAAALDAQMYLGHRIAHHDLVYRFAHRLHHRFVEPQTATLFALHPIEALGFGGLWLACLVACSAAGLSISAVSIAGFAFVNLAFGTISHVGVDPLPDRLRASRLFRWISTPSFHVSHHLNPSVNFGFFTTIWDRAFDTIDPTYDSARTHPLIAVGSKRAELQ